MDDRIIYLVRHGKIQLRDDQRRYIGQLDLPLSEDGVRQAQFLQKILDRKQVDASYCSDLARSRQTAEILAENRGIPVTSLPELREIKLGEWEGCTFADIARRYPQEFKARGRDIGYFRVPGGESFADCGRRAIEAFHYILADCPGNVVLVGHAGVNRLILCHILGMPLTSLFRLSQDYGCLNIIQSSRAGYQVKLMNYKMTDLVCK